MGHAEGEGLSRITTVVPGTDESIGKLVQQIYKLVDIHEVRVLIHLACFSWLVDSCDISNYNLSVLSYYWQLRT